MQDSHPIMQDSNLKCTGCNLTIYDKNIQLAHVYEKNKNIRFCWSCISLVVKQMEDYESLNIVSIPANFVLNGR